MSAPDECRWRASELKSMLFLAHRSCLGKRQVKQAGLGGGLDALQTLQGRRRAPDWPHISCPLHSSSQRGSERPKRKDWEAQTSGRPDLASLSACLPFLPPWSPNAVRVSERAACPYPVEQEGGETGKVN